MNSKPFSILSNIAGLSKGVRLAGAVHNQSGQLFRRSKLLYAKPVSIIFVIAGLLVAALSLGLYQPATATHAAVAIVAYPAESYGETLSLVKVYAEPDDSSQLLRVVAPGKWIEIRGLSENGAWVAMSNEDVSGAAGWVTTAEIRKNILTGTTISLVKVYRGPDSASVLAEVIPPAAKVQVLGHNPDNTWIAIARPAAKGGFIRWVAAGDLKMPAGYMKANVP